MNIILFQLLCRSVLASHKKIAVFLFKSSVYLTVSLTDLGQRLGDICISPNQCAGAPITGEPWMDNAKLWQWLDWNARDRGSRDRHWILMAFLLYPGLEVPASPKEGICRTHAHDKLTKHSLIESKFYSLNLCQIGDLEKGKWHIKKPSEHMPKPRTHTCYFILKVLVYVTPRPWVQPAKLRYLGIFAFSYRWQHLLLPFSTIISRIKRAP